LVSVKTPAAVARFQASSAWKARLRQRRSLALLSTTRDSYSPTM